MASLSDNDPSKGAPREERYGLRLTETISQYSHPSITLPPVVPVAVSPLVHLRWRVAVADALRYRAERTTLGQTILSEGAGAQICEF